MAVEGKGVANPIAQILSGAMMLRPALLHFFCIPLRVLRRSDSVVSARVDRTPSAS